MVLQKKRLVSLALAGVLAASLLTPCFASRTSASAMAYSSEEPAAGSSELVSYTIEYDSYIQNNDHRRVHVASYNNKNPDHTNSCTAVAGTNIIGTYDKDYPNLIPNFEPGAINGSVYMYYPNVGFPAVTGLMDTLYDLMQVNQVAPGATEQQCLNGLSQYVTGKGYDISYSSVYENGTTVDLDKIEDMVAAGKVGIIFCSKFNYVYGFVFNDDAKTVRVSKANYNSAHAMMIYGYIVIDYYKDGQKFLSETYLQATSGFGTADKGYIKLNDYLTIESAYVVNISE